MKKWCKSLAKNWNNIESKEKILFKIITATTICPTFLDILEALIEKDPLITHVAINKIISITIFFIYFVLKI